MNRSTCASWLALTVATVLTASGHVRAACDESSLVRPNGGDHLLYTIERSSQDIGNLKGRKFRLVVNERAAKGLNIRPSGAFRVTQVARFNGSVAFSAEVIDPLALYTRESWGNLPKVVTFQVDCDRSATTRAAGTQEMETVPEIVPVSRPVTVPSIPDSVLPPVSKSAHSPAVTQYEVSSIATATLPPLPEPEPEPEPAPEPSAAMADTSSEPQPTSSVEESSQPEGSRAETRPVRQAALGEPVAGGRISRYETRRVMIDLLPGEEKPSSGGKTLMRYSLTVRNALTRSIQCDISVESSYLTSYASDERTPVDQQVHSAVKLPARGVRSDLNGEISYFAGVLGGSKWMTQDHANPDHSGLQVKNCVPLQGAG